MRVGDGRIHKTMGALSFSTKSINGGKLKGVQQVKNFIDAQDEVVVCKTFKTPNLCEVPIHGSRAAFEHCVILSSCEL